MSRRVSAAVIGALLAALAGCGDGDDRPAVSADDAFSEVERESRKAPDPDRAAPRWEPVATLRGGGPGSESFEVAEDAVNWRARWQCERGELGLSVESRDTERSMLGRERCPGSGSAESLATGRVTLRVTARAPWRVRVSQQVTTRLDEPPLPAMSASGARKVARGDFRGIERRGAGVATLYRLPDGRLSLRFEDFRTSANSDLFVWVSEASRPRTTRQALRAPYRQIALLKSTVGNQNYLLPRDLDESSVRSIVIWCEPVRIAYAAATLAR